MPGNDYVATFRNGSWAPLGDNAAGDGAINSLVLAIALGPSELYAGGQFVNTAGHVMSDFVSEFGPITTYKTDGRIKKGTGSLVGNDIYNTDGTNQSRSGSAAVGSTITFTVNIQNDGDGADQFKVIATGAAAANYQVKYFRGTTEITSQVVAGTYVTGTVAAGGTFAIKAKVKVLSGATNGSSVTRLVTITSVGDASKVDAVKFTGAKS
jgi:hypothetical protein